MRQDWVEFKDQHRCMISIRPAYIRAFSELNDGCKNKNICEIYYDWGTEEESTTPIFVKGTYDQVKQKIMNAEKVDLSDVVVEHFTREEYETLLNIARCERDECEHDNIPTRVKNMNQIINKLSEILKEDK